MTPRIRWSSRGLADLHEIHDYLEREFPAARPRAMRALLRAMDRIGAFANAAPIAIVVGERAYHAALAGNYIVYYEVVDDWAVIARIRDARRDVKGFDPGSSEP